MTDRRWFDLQSYVLRHTTDKRVFEIGAAGRVGRQRRAFGVGWLLKQDAEVISSEFRDDDAQRTADTLAHMWWNSGLRERRFVALLQQARDTTKARISAGQIQSGEPGRRQAMPYCLAVLRSLLPNRGMRA